MTIDETTTGADPTGASGSRWLSGLYVPVHEELTAFDLPVVGELPRELDGRYLRNGPNPVDAPDPATYHWFTGDGMVHGIRLRDGRAEWYRNRWVRSTAVSAALGEAPKPGERHGGMETANTNVIGLAGRTYAIVEAGARPVELTAELETICHSDLGGTLPNGYTAHPKVDPATGSLHAIAYHWALPAPAVRRDRRRRPRAAGRADRGRRRADGPRLLDHRALDGRLRPARHVRPRRRDAGRALPVRVERRPRGPRRSRAARRPGERRALVRGRPVLRVPSRSTPTTTATASCSTSCATSRMFAGSKLGPDESTPQLWRWTIDTATGRVDERQLSDVPLEFPRVDERVVGRRHGTGWASGVRTVDGRSDFGGQLVRIDGAIGRRHAAIDLGPGRLSGEWVMVPRDAGRRRGRRVAAQPRLRPGRGPHRPRRAVGRRARRPARWRRCSCRRAFRSASTATSCRRSEPIRPPDPARSGRFRRTGRGDQALAGTLASAAVAAA